MGRSGPKKRFGSLVIFPFLILPFPQLLCLLWASTSAFKAFFAALKTIVASFTFKTSL